MQETLLAAMFRPMIAAGDALPLYDTATLMEVIRVPELAPELQGFWLQFFPRVYTSTNQKIVFDEIDDNEYRLAPFVAPNVQGRVIRDKGFFTRSFRPAYVKPKHVVDPSRSIARRAGEALLGSMSMAQRYDAIIADNLRRERQMIENRWDWMACQAVVTGMVTVSGEDYPTTTVDFQRDSSLTAVLSGAAKWDQSTASVMSDISHMRQLSFKLGKAPVNTLIFGLDAWAAFLDQRHADIQILLNTLRAGNESLFNASNITDGSFYNFQGEMTGTGGIGRLRLFTYNNYYEDMDTGVGTPYMDPGTVVGVGTALRGMRCFGAIQDRRANLEATDMFTKMWDEEDPSVTYTMTQSAPLMVPMWPNNSFSLKVV